MNLGIPIVASVLKALALGQIKAQNAAFMSAFLTAMQAASTNTFIQSGSSSSESPTDNYSAVMGLKYGLPYFWQNSPNLKFLLSPTDLQKIKAPGAPRISRSSMMRTTRFWANRMSFTRTQREYSTEIFPWVARSRTPLTFRRSLSCTRKRD